MITLMDRDIELDGIDDPIGTFFLKLDTISYRSNDYLGETKDANADINITMIFTYPFNVRTNGGILRPSILLGDSE